MPSGYSLSVEPHHLLFAGLHRTAVGEQHRFVRIALLAGFVPTIGYSARYTDRPSILSLPNRENTKEIARPDPVWESLKETYAAKTENYVLLSPAYGQEEKLAELLNNWGRAPKQQELLLAYLHLSRTEGEVARPKLLKKSGASDAQLKGLVEKGRRPCVGRQPQGGERLGEAFQRPLGDRGGDLDVDAIGKDAHQDVGSGATTQLTPPARQILGRRLGQVLGE